MQQVRKGTNLRTYLFGQHQAFVHGRTRLGRKIGGTSIQDSQVEAESDQFLTGAVVQIAGNSSALFVLKLKQTAGELAQGFFIATELVLDTHSLIYFID